MKRLAVLLAVVAVAAPLTAQEVDTVIGPDTESYFYAAAVAKLTEVDSEFATYLGFNLGWVFDEKFSLGLGVYGLAHPTSQRNVGYGGLLFEGFVAGTNSVHFGVRALVGGGYTELEDDRRGRHHGGRSRDGRSFFVAEPELLLRINLSQSFRVSLSGGYRFVEGGGSVNDDALSAATGSLALAVRF